MQKRNTAADRRKYIRLTSVFPVEIYLRGSHTNTEPQLIQAFTHDVSMGGLCLSVNDPDTSLTSLVASGNACLDVAINMPVTRKPIEARVKVAWHEFKQLKRHKQLLMGVFYETISPQDKNRIVASARRMKWLPKIAIISIVLLAGLLIVSDYRSWQLKSRNEELIASFQRAQKEAEIYKRGVGRMDAKYTQLRNSMSENEQVISKLRAEMASLAAATVDIDALEAQKAQLEESLASAIAEKDLLDNQLKDVIERKEQASRLFDEARDKSRRLEQAAFTNMYQWLTTHRNRFTGLVMSFEGDPAIRDWAFTYDQSLVCQAFLISGDTEKAAQILSFYKNKATRRNNGFVNAYNAATGTPTEEVVHLGPNIWIAIAAAHYTERTGDKTYLGLAEDAANWIISLKDKEGGLRGGPGLPWYSTEHNLDAYALFGMLYEITGKEIYRDQMRNTLAWIKENTYSKKELRMNRGKGDSTIATDTLAWAIAAIGPETLVKEGMDPDAIMNFAEEQCRVTTYFKRPDGETVELTGFDFAKPKNIARNGIVSSEWTAQMVLAYKIMSDYYHAMGNIDKAQDYERKAVLYLGELDKMLISSPSPSGQGAGCLPYASQPSADTGHGWRTPAGGQTGSVSGTAYTLFAKKGYNPLGKD